MSEEFQKELFKPFSQEDNANARTKYKGTGLGMAITQKYVDIMGGSIAVESKKGVGSTFTVEIPLELQEQVIQSEQKQPLHRDLTGVHVLMAEDNDLNAELATIMLEDTVTTYDVVPKEEIAEFEELMRKTIADIVSEASSVACWVYVQKYVKHKTLNEMLQELPDVGQFILAMDTWFEKLMEK